MTGSTPAGFFKRSVFDADADALVDVSERITLLTSEQGAAIFTPLPADAAELDPFLSNEWEVRFTLSDGRVVALAAHQGPVVFDPMTGDPDVAEPDNDYIEAYAPEDSMNNSIAASITGLTGGTSGKLDALTAAQLAFLPNGSELTPVFSGSIAVRYVIRARSPADEAEVNAASGGFKILCDHDAARLWELMGVTKQAQPATWNATSGKWHRVWGIGANGAAVPAMDETGFDLPT